MSILLFSLLCVLSLNYQVRPQIIRSPAGFSRPLTEGLIETPRVYIDAPRTYDVPRNFFDFPYESLRRNYAQPTILTEPCNGVAPNSPFLPSTTVITDCTPSVCKNLADTINLMIVTNLLQNTQGGEEVALRLAAPLIKDLLANPALNFPNSISSFGNPMIPSNVYASNYATPNIVGPNYLAPNFVGSSVYDSSSLAPRIGPSSISPNSPNAAINNGAMFSNLLRLLGGSV